MSTVLWANVLVGGAVTSDQADHGALYAHADKLDALTQSLQLPSFLAVCDTTDQRFNLEDLPLPAGMTSTDEMMAQHGAWMPVANALAMLTALREYIVRTNVRFGLLRNQQSEVLAELDDVIGFLQSQQPLRADRFNFSVVV